MKIYRIALLALICAVLSTLNAGAGILRDKYDVGNVVTVSTSASAQLFPITVNRSYIRLINYGAYDVAVTTWNTGGGYAGNIKSAVILRPEGNVASVYLDVYNVRQSSYWVVISSDASPNAGVAGLTGKVHGQQKY